MVILRIKKSRPFFGLCIELRFSRPYIWPRSAWNAQMSEKVLLEQERRNKVREYQEFIENRLLVDLKYVEDARNKKYEEISQ